MSSTLFRFPCSRLHQKRHADWLCTPSDENDALLSWEVILT